MSAFVLRVENARDRMAAVWSRARDYLEAGEAVKVTVEPVKPTRTLDQNDKMWATLRDISRQVEWHVDGKSQLLPAEDWKEILSAGLRQHQRVAAGMDGGFVVLGERTSRMTIGEMVDLIEMAHAFGAERNVVWSDEMDGGC